MLELWNKLHFEEKNKMESIHHVKNIQYLYLLNKYTKPTFREQQWGTTTIGVVRRQRVKACHTAFRTEFGERRAPSKCCIQKLVRKLETRGSRTNACRLLSLWGLLKGESVQKYTPHSRTTQRRYTPRDSSRQLRQLGQSIPEFGETHSSVLWCERRPISA